MDYNILINSLTNGEPVTVTKPDGTVYTEPRPPTRTALAAARALQNMQQQLANNQNLINQLSKDHHEMWQTLEQIQQQNKNLQDELKSLQTPQTGS